MLSSAARGLKFGPSTFFSKNSLLEHGLHIPTSVNDRVISPFREGFGMFRENKPSRKFRNLRFIQTPQNAAFDQDLHCLINEWSVRI